MARARTALSVRMTTLAWQFARWTLIGIAGAWCLFLMAPILVVVVSAFTSGNYMIFPPPGWSLKWFVEVLSLSWFKTSFVNSVIISVVSTAAAVTVGVLVARALARHRVRGRAVIEYVSLSPLILPAVVLGFALFSVINQFDLADYNMPNLIAGHVLITVPFVVRSVWAAMAGTDISLEEAAQSMGASPVTVFRKVVLPMARPGIMAGAVLAFTYSFNDVAISIFLVGANTTTLPVEVMSSMEYVADPTPAAVSAIMVFITVGFFILVERFGGMRMFIQN